jgi:zinc transporter 11
MLAGYPPWAQAALGTLFTWVRLGESANQPTHALVPDDAARPQGLTAAGAGVVFLLPKQLSPLKQLRVRDGSLGFAAGGALAASSSTRLSHTRAVRAVMLAASFWSLLDPAIEIARESKLYGDTGASLLRARRATTHGIHCRPVRFRTSLGGLFARRSLCVPRRSLAA